MNIAKPWTVTVLETCYGLDHAECPGKQDQPEITLICSCRCHNDEREEPSVSEIDATKRTRKVWTQTELDYLAANANKGAKAIAEALGRSEIHIRNKATQLRISLRTEGSTRGRKQKVQA